MKNSIILIFIFINFSFTNAGMNYTIEANVKTKCKDDFPSSLSFFFEQVGGFGDKSMVSQVEKILTIDLSTFQEYDYMDNEESSEKYWKDIRKFEAVIDKLLLKINANPKYYEKVKYNPIKPEYSFSSDPKERQKILKKEKEYENHPMYGYPNDNKYLSTKGLVEDLQFLKSILKCYKKNGATKIKLSYN
nr:hypothetical protein [uncultured Flavobacterium sp.]